MYIKIFIWHIVPIIKTLVYYSFHLQFFCLNIKTINYYLSFSFVPKIIMHKIANNWFIQVCVWVLSKQKKKNERYKKKRDRINREMKRKKIVYNAQRINFIYYFPLYRYISIYKYMLSVCFKVRWKIYIQNKMMKWNRTDIYFFFLNT